jgi:hypothetical protein
MGWRGLREVRDCQLSACSDRLLGEDSEAVVLADMNSSEGAVAVTTVVNEAHVVAKSGRVDDETRLKLREVEGGVCWFVAYTVEETRLRDDLTGVLVDELVLLKVNISPEACASVVCCEGCSGGGGVGLELAVVAVGP